MCLGLLCVCECIRELWTYTFVHQHLGKVLGCFVLTVCLCANEIAGSRPNKRFPGTYSGSVVSPLSASPVLWAALTKVCLFDHKVFRACVLHEVNPGASPFLCFLPSYPFFFLQQLRGVIVEKRGVDACEAGGVTVPPQME